MIIRGLVILLVCLALHLTEAIFAAGPPAIKIDSVTPDGPWQPGDSLKITMKVSYTDAPYPGRVDFILREVSETQTKDLVFNTSETSIPISFGQQSASKTLARGFYNVPNRSCMLRRSDSTPQCSFPATFAETLTKLSKIQLMARLLDGSSNIVASAMREIDLSYPEVASVSVQSQPLMSERPMRIVVNGAKFTEAESISIDFRKVGTPLQAFFPRIYSNPAFNRACTPPRGGAEGLGYCSAKIIDDTTIEFAMRTFVSSVSGGNLELDSALEKFIGSYDLHVNWVARQPAPENFYYRAPDAVVTDAYTVTAPIKDDFLEIKKLTLTQTSPPKKEEYLPGGNTLMTFAPNASVTATVEFDYKLSRRLGCNIFFGIRKTGQAAFLGFPRGGQFWNTVGQVVRSDGSDPPRQSPYSHTFTIPADASGLEFSLIMTDIAGNHTQEEAIFVRSQPLVLGSGLGVNPSRLEFNIEEESPELQTVRLANSTTNNLDFNITTKTDDGGHWLQVVPLTGTLLPNDTRPFAVGVLRSSLAAQITNTGTITISGSSLSSPRTVPVIVVQKVARLVGLEVVQVVQDWTNSVSLFAGKPTTVRAHLESTLLKPAKVTGTLLIQAEDGSEFELNPSNPEIEPKFNAARLDRRAGINSSLNFSVPLELVTNAVFFQLKADGVLCREIAETPNDCRALAIFQSPPRPRIQFVDIIWTDSIGGTHSLGTKGLKDLARRLISCYPITGITATLSEFRWQGLGPPDLSVVLDTLDWMRLLDASLSPAWTDRIYYGAIAHHEIGGLAYVWGDVGTSYVLADPFAEGRHSHSHEIAHILGQHHAPFCGAEGSDGVPAFPYVSDGRPTLGPMTDDPNTVVFGFDHLTKEIISPEHYFELMSYCRTDPLDRWPSKFTYQQLRTSISLRFDGTSPKPPPSIMTFFRGRINSITQALTFTPPVTLPVVSGPPSPAPGDYLLQALNASGQVLQRVAFSPKEAKPDGNIPAALSFIIPVTADPAITQVQVIRSNQVLGTLSASANPPTVEMISPNGGENLSGPTVDVRWNGSDADGDALAYAVQYSPDNGTNWQTLIADLTSTNYTAPSALLQQTTVGRLRVIASDGFHTAIDASDGTFTVPNNAPELSIESPTPNELFLGNRQVVFEAFAYDVEDGVLEGTNVTWRSDRDGLLGNGSSLFTTATALSEGRHVITATLRDSADLEVNAQVNIMVQRAVPAKVTDLVANQSSQTAVDGLTVTISAINHGPSDAAGVKMTDEIPIGSTVLSANSSQGTCAVTNGLLACDIGLLAADAKATVTLRLGVQAAGTYTNRASVTGFDLDPTPANNVTTASITAGVQPPRLEASITSAQLILSWPMSATGFSLQSAASLTPPVNWLDVPAPVNLSGDRNVVTVSLPNAAQFYRLVKP